MEEGYPMHKSLVSILVLAVLMVGSVAGVAWAAENFIQCPGKPSTGGWTPDCFGTNGNDEMHGTDKNDSIYGRRGVDAIYGHGGTDRLYGNEGPDVVYGGPGGDDLYTDCEAREAGCGKDEKHVGPGDDFVSGSLPSERYFGERGDDQISDHGSPENPDYIRCGPGNDRVYYNKGVDKVSGDCEELFPVQE